MRILCVETEQWVGDYLKKALTGHEVAATEQTVQDATLDSGTEVLSVFVNSRVTKNILDALPKLKLIATRSTGFDHIDLASCSERGIVVSTVPSYGERTVAEYTFALMLALSRKLYPALRRVREEGSFHTDGLRGFDLAGKTLGVIGTGRIGCHVIEIAQGFAMNVVAYDPFPKPDLEKTCNMKYVTLDELLAQADIISMHAPYMPTTHHLLNSKNMQRIKHGAVLVNTARGALIETAALVEALSNGTLAGAAVDVLEEEGFVGEERKLLNGKTADNAQMQRLLADHQLMAFPNVLISPHNAFNTQEALERILDTTVQNIQAFASGTPQNVAKP